jgi:protein gp37
MENSRIEWTTHTFNPFLGCAKVSPGCAFCYAEKLMATRFGRVTWGKGETRIRTKADTWRQPRRWNRRAAKARKAAIAASLPPPPRPRVFCASLADWLDEEIPLDGFTDLLALIEGTRELQWLLLSKRLQNWRPRLEAAEANARARGMPALADFILAWLDGTAPEHIAIGTSVEDQPRADERLPLILSIPALVRFLSCEPLLGPVHLRKASKGLAHIEGNVRIDGLHWVIAGGESGENARPMHPDWARSLRDQCAAAGIAFFFKQWGEWAPLQPDANGESPTLGVDDCEVGRQHMRIVGKAEAGRLLDGREHDDDPFRSRPRSPK